MKVEQIGVWQVLGLIGAMKADLLEKAVKGHVRNSQKGGEPPDQKIQTVRPWGKRDCPGPGREGQEEWRRAKGAQMGASRTSSSLSSAQLGERRKRGHELTKRKNVAAQKRKLPSAKREKHEKMTMSNTRATKTKTLKANTSRNDQKATRDAPHLRRGRGSKEQIRQIK